MTKEEVRAIVTKNGYAVVEENRTGNNLGTVLKLNNGCIVNCWNNGNHNCQGKNKEAVEYLLTQAGETKAKVNRKVFVVYGHDTNARTQLEAMLRRWDLEPLILDQLASSGQTIIEKLEEYTPQASFGIVLATPDDVGYAKNHEVDKKYRVRQNVVLEMGMLLAAKGRDKVAILLSQTEDMEKPSDIDGLIYIPFRDNVEEVKLSLAKEMQKNGYILDIGRL